MPAVEEFIANDKTIEQIGEEIGADLLYYQTLEDLIEMTSINGEQEWDSSCFNGKYITGDIDQDYLEKLGALRNDGAKKAHATLAGGGIDLHNDH